MLKKIALCAIMVFIAAGSNYSVGKAQSDKTPRLTAKASEVNVREGPGANYTVVDYIQPGDFFLIIGQHGSWWLIKIQSVDDPSPDYPVGWVSAAYVTALNVDRVPAVGVCAFPSHIAPDCPAYQRIEKLTYQPFEHGIMLWYSARREVDVLYDNACSMLNGDGFATEIYQDTWSGEALQSQTPPPGLQQPQRGFGKVWLDQNLRQRLGWATAGEASYTTLIETNYPISPSQTVRYLRLPSKQIIQIGGYNGDYYWVYQDKGQAGKC